LEGPARALGARTAREPVRHRPRARRGGERLEVHLHRQGLGPRRRTLPGGRLRDGAGGRDVRPHPQALLHRDKPRAEVLASNSRTTNAFFDTAAGLPYYPWLVTLHPLPSRNPFGAEWVMA